MQNDDPISTSLSSSKKREKDPHLFSFFLSLINFNLLKSKKGTMVVIFLTDIS